VFVPNDESDAPLCAVRSSAKFNPSLSRRS
jgi:hypothetical protein